MSLAALGLRLSVRRLKWTGLQHVSKKLYTSLRPCCPPCPTKSWNTPLRYNPVSSVLRAASFHSSTTRLKKREPEDAPPRELDLVRYDLRALKESPKPALYLGLGGLVPFVSAPVLMAVTETYLPEVAYAQVVYGASIVSFLGGVRWGFALPAGSPAKPDWLNLANSVVPSLLAWAALLLSHDIVQAGIMVIMGLGIALHYDLSLLPTYPSWFKALRTILTTVAIVSLVTVLVLKGILPEKRYLTDK